MKFARLLLAGIAAAGQRLALTVVLFPLVFPLVAWAQPVAIDHCGQYIAGSGFLVQNLDCSLDAPAHHHDEQRHAGAARILHPRR